MPASQTVEKCRCCGKTWDWPARPPRNGTHYHTARGYCSAKCMVKDFDNWITIYQGEQLNAILRKLKQVRLWGICIGISMTVLAGTTLLNELLAPW